MPTGSLGTGRGGAGIGGGAPRGPFGRRRYCGGADRALHTKLGPGGLSDVEWVAQLLQLRYGAQVPALRTTGTRAALAAAVNAGLMSEEDRALLDDAWYQTTRMRNGITLARARS